MRPQRPKLAAVDMKADDGGAFLSMEHEKAPSTAASPGVDHCTALMLEIIDQSSLLDLLGWGCAQIYQCVCFVA